MRQVRRHPTLCLLAVFVATTIGFISCGNGDDGRFPYDDFALRPASCVPGTTMQCTGPQQCIGQRKCNPSGTRWGPCLCNVRGPTDAAVSNADAATDGPTSNADAAGDGPTSNADAASDGPTSNADAASDGPTSNADAAGDGPTSNADASNDGPTSNADGATVKASDDSGPAEAGDDAPR